MNQRNNEKKERKRTTVREKEPQREKENRKERKRTAKREKKETATGKRCRARPTHADVRCA